jgi:hypothetical protein
MCDCAAMHTIQQQMKHLEKNYPGRFTMNIIQGRYRFFENTQFRPFGLTPRMDHVAFAAWLDGFVSGMTHGRWYEQAQQHP